MEMDFERSINVAFGSQFVVGWIKRNSRHAKFRKEIGSSRKEAVNFKVRGHVWNDQIEPSLQRSLHKARVLMQDYKTKHPPTFSSRSQSVEIENSLNCDRKKKKNAFHLVRFLCWSLPIKSIYTAIKDSDVQGRPDGRAQRAGCIASFELDRVRQTLERNCKAVRINSELGCHARSVLHGQSHSVRKSLLRYKREVMMIYIWRVFEWQCVLLVFWTCHLQSSCLSHAIFD